MLHKKMATLKNLTSLWKTSNPEMISNGLIRIINLTKDLMRFANKHNIKKIALWWRWFRENIPLVRRGTADKMFNKIKWNRSRRGRTMQNVDKIFRKRSKSILTKKFNTANKLQSNN